MTLFLNWVMKLWKGGYNIGLCKSYLVCIPSIPNHRAVASLSLPGGQDKKLSSFSFIFPHFSLNLSPFSSSFWTSGWASRPPGKALATPLPNHPPSAHNHWALTSWGSSPPYKHRNSCPLCYYTTHDGRTCSLCIHQYLVVSGIWVILSYLYTSYHPLLARNHHDTHICVCRYKVQKVIEWWADIYFHSILVIIPGGVLTLKRGTGTYDP